MKTLQQRQKLVVKCLLALIWFYRLCLSPFLGANCRFLPSCSTYALEAISVHGSLTGVWLTLKRIAKCHPWGGEGLDFVPPKQ